MRIIISILLIAIFALLAEYYFAWWSIAIVCFFVTMILGLQPGASFRSGFLGIALLWLTISLLKDIPNHHILSQKLAQVFHLPNYALFILVTIIIGGLVGGLSGWSGSLVRKVFS